MRALLGSISGSRSVLETGSALQVGRLVAEGKPEVVLWDEALGEPTGIVSHQAQGSLHLVLLTAPGTVSSPGREPHVTRIEKLDFARGSVDEYARVQVPRLEQLFWDLESLESPTAGEKPRSVPIRLVVLGASTGGPAATKKVLEVLPRDFPCPIAVVQHIDAGYEAGYAGWLGENTKLTVRLARDGDSPGPGEVIIAPTGSHLVYQNHGFVLDDGPKLFSQKPAVDRLFGSAAPHWGPGLVGVLLTGIGSDGAQGCRSIVDAGGWTLVQDEATSTVWGMPRAAWERGGASQVLPLEEIGPRLAELVVERSLR